MMKITIRINSVNQCPYCGKPAKKVTCGSVFCQMEHHRKLMSKWWKEKGKVWNGLKRKRYR